MELAAGPGEPVSRAVVLGQYRWLAGLKVDTHPLKPRSPDRSPKRAGVVAFCSNGCGNRAFAATLSALGSPWHAGGPDVVHTGNLPQRPIE